jgi:hypothetical protein
VQQLRARQHELTTDVNALRGFVMVNTYLRSSYGRSTYIWEAVQLSATLTTHDNFTTVSYTWVDANGKTCNDVSSSLRGVPAHEMKGASAEQLIAATVLKINGAYAEHVIGKEIAQLRRYITWQVDRVTKWQPAELQLITERVDKKTGFDMESK